MAEEIIIKVKADTTEFTPSIEQVQKLGKIAEADVKAFNTLDKAIKEGVNKGIKDAAVQMKAFMDASEKGTKKTADGFTSLRQQIKAARDEASKFQDQNSAGAIAAQKNLADLIEKQSDLNQRVQALNPEAKFQAFSQVTSGAIGGLQTLTGALQAFGVENEQVQEIAQRLQGVLNLSQGINSILSLGDAMSNLKVVLGLTTAAQTSLAVANEAEAATATQAAVATTGFNAALLASPIGPLLLAIGALVGALVLVAKATEDNSEAIGKQNEEYLATLKLQDAVAQGYLDVADASKKQSDFAAERAALLGASESEVLAIKLKQLETEQQILNLALQEANDAKIVKGINDDRLATEREIELTKLRINKAIRDEALAAQEAAFKARQGDADFIKTKKDPTVIQKDIKDTVDVIGQEIKTLSTDIPSIDIPIGITDEDLEQLASQLEVAGELTSAFFELNNQLSAQETQNRISDLDAQLKAGTITQEAYNKEIKKIRTEQAIQAKNQATFEAIINGAVAIVNSLKVDPTGALAIKNAILTGLQIAAIQSRPIPKFKKGTLNVPGVNQGGDTVHAMLQPGEAVIPRDTTKQYMPVLDAIYNRKIPAKVLNSYIKSGNSTQTVKAKMNPFDMRYAMDGVGIKVKNAGQIASLIAEKMNDNYSRTRLRLGLE